jgi:hypothetical protein
MQKPRSSAVLLLTMGFLLCAGTVYVPSADAKALRCSITKPAGNATVPSPVRYVAKVRGGQAPYTYQWSLPGGKPKAYSITTSKTQCTVTVNYQPGTYRATVKVIDSTGRPVAARDRVKIRVPKKSINSTSANRAKLPKKLVQERAFTTRRDFQVVAANDLGMHCGDLDHRIASILPPFNVVHAQVIHKDAFPDILDVTNVQAVYSAASNPRDPAQPAKTGARIFKTNFWDLNPRGTGNTLAFDAYNPFYPPNVLGNFPLPVDTGLPVPDLEKLYPLAGPSALVAEQERMPGFAAHYSVNGPQQFGVFYNDLPFFVNFPFGYRVDAIRWFSAEGIPIAPFDDLGRKNAFPLLRIQAKDATGALTGTPRAVLSSLDVVTPVSAEADCYRCHTSAQDGGNGRAACIQGVDSICPSAPPNFQGSPRGATTPFTVATAAQDTALVPDNVSREWAADINILRLHDARHGTALEASTPVVCQRCHYSPALDLAHVGPVAGPDANGREQTSHHSNSSALHTFHGGLAAEGLFAAELPPPTDPRRTGAGGRPVVNDFVTGILNETCYQCHPGRVTKCLRGAMFNGGLVCQDCHGGMLQVGDDFTVNFPVTPGVPDLNKRVPWASEPHCGSCHTGDALDNLGLTDLNVIPAADGIRLLRAYRTTDTATAAPIVATNRRFAENQTAGGTQMLYRVSKDSHAGVFCEACHGSTHAEWPVKPESGAFISNDNQAALQLQGHTGKLIECGACHGGRGPSLSLGGPHGLHPVGDQRWINAHEELLERGLARDQCRTCHGARGQGTVLGKVAAKRKFTVEERGHVTLAKGSLVRCNICHENPL